MAIYKDKNSTKDGRSYYFKVYKNGVQYKSKRYLTKQEANKEQATFILKKDNPVNKPFKLIANDYFRNLYNIRKESTVYTYIKDYNNHIKPFFDDLNINNINTQVIREWAEKMQKKKLSVAYMNKIYNVLKCIFDFAIKNYGLETNPVSNYGRFQEKNDKVIKDSEKIKYITLEDFNQFISIVDNSMWKTFFITAYYTGCRKGEMLALTWDDIDFNKNEIIINKTLYEEIKGKITITNTKNKKNRKIKMSKTLSEQLLTFKNEMSSYKDFSKNWFVFGCTKNLSTTTIDRYKHYYFEKSGIKEITMHEFRHSHVSLLINEYLKTGQTDTAKFFIMLSNRMGHSIQVMQDTYMHLFPTIQDEIVDLLNNL